jgi:hypothetical protein
LTTSLLREVVEVARPLVVAQEPVDLEPARVSALQQEPIIRLPSVLVEPLAQRRHK